MTGGLGLLLADIGPDRWGYYLALGMVATVNPCGFAMLPAYLAYFLGIERQGDDAETSVVEASVVEAIKVAAAVSAGFLAVFAVAGAAIELTSLPVNETSAWVSIVIGVALFALGVAMLFGFELSLRLPRLDRGGRERTVGSMFVFGLSYAIASLGCTMPLFLIAVVGTFDDESFASGLGVFGLYALGMALVLTALTVGMALARTSIVRFLRAALPYIGRISGGLVALAGAYVTYYGWLQVRLGTDGAVEGSNISQTVGGWSDSVSTWITDVGAVRIAVVVAILLTGTVLAVRALRPVAADADRADGADGEARTSDGGRATADGERPADDAEAEADGAPAGTSSTSRR